MDIVSRVIRRVELNDPIDFGNIETSCCYVCAKEVACRSVTELEEGVGSFLLFLFALHTHGRVSIRRNESMSRITITRTHMQIKYRHIDVIQQLGVVLYGIAARKEDDNLLLCMPLQKRKQQQEPFIGFAHSVPLFQVLCGRRRLVLVDIDVQWTRTERDSRKVCDFGSLCSREEHRLTVFCKGYWGVSYGLKGIATFQTYLLAVTQ
jgi:hypothetical protein